MTRLSFDQIREELDMEFFLDRESIPFKVTRGSSGTQLNIKTCPMPDCGDTRWRTYFGLENGRGNCFVCNGTFDAPKFIHNYLGAENWGTTFRFIEEVLRDQGWRPKRTNIVSAVDHGDIMLPISDELPLPDGSNLAYLENRGFNAEIARYFHLRWCQFGWWKFNQDGESKTQNFANRIIIPVFDLDGSLKTFQGRDLTGLSDKKYLFPVGLPGTGRYLFNGQNVLATDHVAMGEGAFDVAAIKIAMDEDPALRHVIAVGSFGKHLSYGSLEGDDQLGRFIRLRSKGLKTVTIMWDGESAALVAALNAAKLLTGVGLQARIAFLPKDKDPNEVPAQVVREAFYKAELWTPGFDVKMRLRNPYK